jgi:hypothetical protein
VVSVGGFAVSEQAMVAQVRASSASPFRDVGFRRMASTKMPSGRSWVLKPNRALGGAIPLQMHRTDIGANAVFEELGRIDYGVFV